MIVWGSGGDIASLGHAAHEHCETCEKGQSFITHLQYRYAHLYWIFSWVTKKQYAMVCNVCSNGWKLDTKKMESSLAKSPIPFHRRYGWVVPAGLVALVIVSASLGK